MRLMTSSNCALACDQVVVLLGQELMALLGFLVFLDGHEVHRADLVEALLQRLDLLRDGVPIRAHAARGHFLRRQRLRPWPGLRRHR